MKMNRMNETLNQPTSSIPWGFFCEYCFFCGFFGHFSKAKNHSKMNVRGMKCSQCNKVMSTNYKGNESSSSLNASYHDKHLKVFFKIKNPLCMTCFFGCDQSLKYYLIDLTNVDDYEDIDLNVGPVLKSSVPIQENSVQTTMEVKELQDGYTNVQLKVPKGVQLISCNKCSSTPHQVNSKLKQVCLQCYINGLQVKLCVICQDPVRNVHAKTCANERCLKQATAIRKKNPNKKKRKVEQSNELTK